MQEDSAQPQQTQIQEDSINLRHYWHVVLERRWLVITAFVTVFVLCLVYLFNAVPIYQAVTRVQIDRETGNVLNLNDAFQMDTRDLDYLQTQYKNLQSRALIETVIKKLKLDFDPRYEKEQDKAKAVLDDVVIAPVRLSRHVDIKVEHPDPRTAVKIADAIAEEFIQIDSDQKMEKSLKAIQTLRQDEQTRKDKLDQAEKAVSDFQKVKNLSSLDEKRNTLDQALKETRLDYDKVSNEAAQAEKEAEAARKWVEDKNPVEMLPKANDDIVIQRAKERKEQLEAIYEGKKQIYLPGHPQMKQLWQQIVTERTNIATQAVTVYSGILERASSLASKRDALLVQLKARDKEVLEMEAVRGEYQTLQLQALNARKFFDRVLESIQATELLRANVQRNISIRDKAALPVKPIKPRRALVLCLGMFGGLVVAVALAFFVNYLDDSIKSQDDVEAYLKLPFLGYVPNIKTNSVVERDLQAHLHPQSNAAEGFRTIRAAVSLTHQADKLRAIAVTSTIPSEGKSLVASNLAIVLAQTGMKTLLIDADLRRPSVHKSFQLQSPIGLSSYLLEKVNSADEFIHTSEVPNLDVVCCGAVPTNPSELIGSKRMHDFIRDMRNRYDRVILDCPPVSAVSDPLVVAANSDGVVFVTKFNKIRREHARKSVQRIQNAGIHIIGNVLNDIDFEGRDSYYYSYYYYQNRYYSSHYQSVKEGSDQPAAKKKEKA